METAAFSVSPIVRNLDLFSVNGLSFEDYPEVVHLHLGKTESTQVK